MLVHFAAPADIYTACGRAAVHEDGRRILETDLDIDKVSCKPCLKSGRCILEGKGHEA